MRYSKVFVEAVGCELAPNVVTSLSLEERLEPVYRALSLKPGQLEAFTGIRERRWWPPGFRLSEGAARAGLKALEGSSVKPSDIGLLAYTGVCREGFEPATACAVADRLGVAGAVEVLDLSNACLGVLNGMALAADRIELGRIRAALVVSCESARDIVELALARMLERPALEEFTASLATLTGGSGAVGVLLSDGSFGPGGHRLLGGALRAAPEHHALCRWGVEPVPGAVPAHARMSEVMVTDPVAVLKNGVVLGRQTWNDFLRELAWTPESVDRVVCHQVGKAHQDEILKALGIPPEKDFTTFEYLGNIGTVSLPLTLALAAERGHIEPGHKAALLGIGSGLNCLMLGLEW